MFPKGKLLEVSNKTFNILQRSLGLANYISKFRDGALLLDLEFIHYR